MMLELRNIYKTYIQGKMDVPVLKDVSLSVEEGEYVAIMGPSGSGKTTLMNIIGCLDTPTSGEYLLEGQDLSSQSDARLSDVRLRAIGFVFQSFYLLSRQSALENVALPLLYAGVKGKERLEIARQALERVGLADRADFKPTQLSGGQCQRVAIARAIVNNPKILLADEPTGALDTASGEQVMEIFQKLNDEGVTIIMITHEQEIADHAHRILYIRDGMMSTVPVHTHTEKPAQPAADEPEFDDVELPVFEIEDLDFEDEETEDEPEAFYAEEEEPEGEEAELPVFEIEDLSPEADEPDDEADHVVETEEIEEAEEEPEIAIEDLEVFWKEPEEVEDELPLDASVAEEVEEILLEEPTVEEIEEAAEEEQVAEATEEPEVAAEIEAAEEKPEIAIEDLEVFWREPEEAEEEILPDEPVAEEMEEADDEEMPEAEAIEEPEVAVEAEELEEKLEITIEDLEVFWKEPEEAEVEILPEEPAVEEVEEADEEIPEAADTKKIKTEEDEAPEQLAFNIWESFDPVAAEEFSDEEELPEEPAGEAWAEQPEAQPEFEDISSGSWEEYPADDTFDTAYDAVEPDETAGEDPLPGQFGAPLQLDVDLSQVLGGRREEPQPEDGAFQRPIKIDLEDLHLRPGDPDHEEGRQ